MESSHPDSAEPRLHLFADRATGVLLIAMVIFSPWAFGGWPKWSIWTMNVGGYAVGLLYFAKMITRWRTGFRPVRWGGRQPAFIRYGLGTITVLLLAWCLTSAINARAVVDLEKLVLVEKPRWISWLPHSYDQPSTWFAFWQYLGLAGVFWALRDWVSVATSRERLLWAGRGVPLNPSAQSELSDSPESSTERAWLAHHLPDRLSRLLWVLCVNGAAVALVGIISTFDNPSKVLWLLPHETRSGNFFGPFYYRNHGAAFANLLWPVCLGLWLVHSLKVGNAPRGFLASMGRSRSSLLPVCLVALLVAPFVSGSRGAAIVAGLLVLGSLPVLYFSFSVNRLTLFLTSGVVLAAGALGIWLAWEPLQQRFFRDFFLYPTGVERPMRDFTIRAVLRVPSTWDPVASAFAGLSDTPTLLWHRPGSVTLSLPGPGVFEARFLETNIFRVLTLRTTNAVLAETGRPVEIIFTHQGGQSALYLNGEPQALHAAVTKVDFALPEDSLRSYLWVGRGEPWAMHFRGRIEVVTLLGYALDPAAVKELAQRGATPGFTLTSQSVGARWPDLSPGPILEVRPYSFSPSQWKATGLSGRIELARESQKMMVGYPALFGIGPGAFAALFKVFRGSTDPQVDWFAHNDFLETRITFGLAGVSLVITGLLLCPVAALARGGFPLPRYGFFLVLTGLAGALVHAMFDWIFQVHSLLFATVVLGGLLAASTLSPEPLRSRLP